MKRAQKIHRATPNSMGRFPGTRCGTDGPFNFNDNAVTCRACMFHILTDVAPWARGFLNDLRTGKGLTGKRAAVTRPARTPEAVNRQIEHYRAALGSPFREQGGSQKAISELLPFQPALWGTVEEIVHPGRPPADAVGVQGGDVAEDPWNTG